MSTPGSACDPDPAAVVGLHISIPNQPAQAQAVDREIFHTLDTTSSFRCQDPWTRYHHHERPKDDPGSAGLEPNQSLRRVQALGLVMSPVAHDDDHVRSRVCDIAARNAMPPSARPEAPGVELGQVMVGEHPLRHRCVMLRGAIRHLFALAPVLSRPRRTRGLFSPATVEEPGIQ